MPYSYQVWVWRNPFYPFWCLNRKLATSDTKIELSKIAWVGTKALYCCEIRLGEIHFSRLARTLEVILYVTLHRLMGLSWLISRGCNYFRIRATFLKLMFFNIFSEERIENTSIVTSEPTIAQYFWKNKGASYQDPGIYTGASEIAQSSLPLV